MPTQPGAKTISDKVPFSTLKVALALALTALSVSLPARAQERATPQQSSATEEDPEQAIQRQSLPGNVIVDGNTILTVYQSIAGLTPQQRADKIADRIIGAARDPNVLPESVKFEPHDGWTEI